MRILAGVGVVIALFAGGFVTGRWWAAAELATTAEPLPMSAAEPVAGPPGADLRLDRAAALVPEFGRAVERRDWPGLVRLVETARVEGRPAEFQTLYTAMRALARELVAADAPVEAITLLRAFSELNPQDHDVRFELAGASLAAGEYAAALTPLLEILAAPLTTEVAERAAEELDRIVALEAARLSLDGNAEALIALYQALVVAEPTREAHQAALVLAQLEAGDVDSAESTLASIPGFELATEELDALAQRVRGERSELRLERGQGELYATVSGGAETVRLLVDTGASQTALSPAALARLTARRTDEVRRVLTANGPIEARVFEVPELELAGRTFSAVPVLELLSVPVAADGLLGLDLLQQIGEVAIGQRVQPAASP